MQRFLRLRITVVDPVPGVALRVQSGRAELLAPSRTSEIEISFDFAVRIDRRPTGEPNFLGPFAQGPASGRFVYVNVGTSAGQFDSPWTRRAKVHLRSIRWEQIEAAIGTLGGALEARIAGRDKRGGPACATVPLLGGGWTLISVPETA